MPAMKAVRMTVAGREAHLEPQLVGVQLIELEQGAPVVGIRAAAGTMEYHGGEDWGLGARHARCASAPAHESCLRR
jgi:hypothetical protein